MDKDYRHTARQIEQMMQGAQQARIALMELSQELIYFNLEHHRRNSGHFDLRHQDAWCRQAVIRLGGTMLPVGEFWQVLTPDSLKGFLQVTPKYEHEMVSVNGFAIF